MASGAQRRWSAKLRLWRKQRGLCHFCGRRMKLTRKSFGKQPLPCNIATIDHLYSRLSGERGNHPFEVNLVLSCHECNQRRGAEEEASLGIEELRRRGRQGCRD